MNFSEKTALSRGRCGAVLSALVLVLAACGDPADDAATAPADDSAASSSSAAESAATGAGPSAAGRLSDREVLAAILAAQPGDVQARYIYRQPQETLELFGIEPGMTVIEALPGGGWYSKLLVPFLGSSGMLIGADYSTALFPNFGFYTQEQLAAKETWPQDWTAEVHGWAGADGADIDAFQWGSMPPALAGEVDAVLFIRALHNLARFEQQGGFLTEAIAEAYTALRPGGVVGVVQHMAPEEAADDWANGDNGYLKKSFVVEQFEAAGFELVEDSAMHVNPADQPTEADRVWRLPPMMMGTRDDADAAAAVREIGESTRMTLLFRKPV